MSFGVAKCVSLAALVLSNAAALSNASPAMLLSFKQSLPTIDDAATVVPTMDYFFRSLAPTAVDKCGYDAYIFVKQSNVSESEINAFSMPHLAHLVDKAQSKYVQGTVLAASDEDLRASVSDLQSALVSQCGAARVVADAAAKPPFPLYADTQPRVIDVELAADWSLAEADEAIQQIVGHVPSASFLVAYYTTPREDSAASTFGSANATLGEIPYESVFRNYQFFSPALFMGIAAAVFFMAVFGIAFRAVNSLEISHAAFEPKREAPKKSN